MHDDYISHYGVKRRSGRYPWGSGDEPFQRGSEGTINGVAKDLHDRDLKAASKSLGISNTKISDAKSNTDYNDTMSALRQSYSSSGSTSNNPYDIKNAKSESVTKKLPSNAYWDNEKNCWAATGSVAYWDVGKESWVTAGNTSSSRIYYNDVSDRWINEDGENVCEDSKNTDSRGYRYAPEGIPGNAKWNSKEERWEINSVDSGTWQKNKATGDLEPVVRNDETGEWEPAAWNSKTKKWESIRKKPVEGGNKVDIYPKRSIKPAKKSWFNSLKSAVDNMGSFFKRKISEIIDKFDD